jgi:SAM-dependent methyltransferase
MNFGLGCTEREPSRDPVVRSFVRQHVPSPKTFVSLIDQEDEMFLFGLQADRGARRRNAINYYSIGSRISGAIKHIGDWQFSGLEHVGAFLDFACGYGRSTRFLVREVPPKRIWACDIYPRAVAFQKQHYGVHGIVSVPDPADFPKQNSFDYIFACSFFTHMPETTFSRWIETLYGLLTERGILVFSTLDASLLPPSVDFPPSGILFGETSESRTLDKSQYGACYVDRHFVTRVVDSVTGGKAYLHRIERGIERFQDIYIVARNLDRDFSDLKFIHDPGGSLDWGELGADGTAFLRGWAADINPRGAIKEVQFISKGRVIATVVPSQDRPDVAEFFQRPALLHSGWNCNVQRELVRLRDIIEIKVVNGDGQSTLIAYDFLLSMVRRAQVER